MANISKRTSIEKNQISVTEKLQKLGHDSIGNLVRMDNEEFPVPENERVLNSMLITDYELAIGREGGRFEGQECLRIRRRLSLEINATLLSYEHSKRKASDSGADSKGGLTVMIQNNAGDAVAKKQSEPIIQIDDGRGPDNQAST